MSKLYEINVEEAKNTIYVKASGFFKEEDAKAYVNDFQTAANSVDRGAYKLIVDATEQKAVAQAVVDELKGVLNLYSSFGFKQIVIINPASNVSKMQIRNSANQIGFKGDFVDNLTEAYSL